MARPPGEEKTESIFERLHKMNDKKEKLDVLLDKNAAEQMAKVNFDELNSVISKRLDQIDKGGTTTCKGPVVFKLAAGLAATAAIILIAFIIDAEKPVTPRTEQGRRAIVKFIDTKAAAKVTFTSAAKSKTFVSISRPRVKTAACEIKIIDTNGELIKKGDRPAWIMITKPKPELATNGAYEDMINTMFLF